MKKVQDATSKIYYQAAQRLGLRVQVVDQDLLRIFKRGKSFYFLEAKTPFNSLPSIKISQNKRLTNKILKTQGIPTSKQRVLTSKAGLEKILDQLNFPLVIKPESGSSGRKVFVQISNRGQALTALAKVKEKYSRVIVEEYFAGQDYRFLVLKKKVIAILKREPPKIIGDGQHTVKELIDLENQKRKERGQENQSGLKHLIRFSRLNKQILEKKGIYLKSIPAKNKTIYLKKKTNISRGGVSHTLGKQSVHPSYLDKAIAVAKILGLNLAAVDILTNQPQKPFSKKSALVLETNSAPGLSPFYYPFYGRPIKVAEKIVRAL